MAKREVAGKAGRSERWTKAEARAVVADWEQSGKSGAEYGRSIGVVPQRLFWWRRRLGGGCSDTVSFVPVVARETPRASRGAALVVSCGDRLRVEVHDVDATTAAWVVAVLAGETPS
jgi:transposase-like protein